MVWVWVWVNTYSNTIFSGMNIHFKPAMTWGSRHGTRVSTHPQMNFSDLLTSKLPKTSQLILPIYLPISSNFCRDSRNGISSNDGFRSLLSNRRLMRLWAGSPSRWNTSRQCIVPSKTKNTFFRQDATTTCGLCVAFLSC